MDPVVLGALIAAASAVGGGGIAVGGNVYLEHRRQEAQERQADKGRAHDQRQRRYDERKAAYEDFFTQITGAERDTLEFEAEHGDLPGDWGHDPEYRKVDDSLARLQFVASDECLEAAEACSRAFYAWGWGNGTHTQLYEAMNEFTRAVRIDLDVNVSGYTRPVPTPRRTKKGQPPQTTGA